MESNPTSDVESIVQKKIAECTKGSRFYLDLRELNLETLPANIPAILTELDASVNKLTTLPEKLPSLLKYLYLSNNNLRTIPEILPRFLRHLSIINNDLISLPENLPSTLRFLNVEKNNLTSLPENLPASLIALNISENNITKLPDYLPYSLKILTGHDMNLNTFPIVLPPLLLEVDFRNNQLTELPSYIQNCDSTLRIFIDNNPLSAASIEVINAVNNDSNRSCPQISFSMYCEDDSAPIKPLQDEIEDWLGQVDEIWNDIAEEPGAEAFSQFLSKLRKTINYENEKFKEEVSTWLRQLAEKNDDKFTLREKIFVIAEESTQSCEDRTTWSYNQMKALNLANDVANGNYDEKLLDLIKIARGTFRLNILEQIARNKVKTLNFVDEIEVYLVYQVKLRETLSLPIDSSDMRYAHESWVTEEDLDSAVTEVMKREKTEFLDYLSIDWQPWKEVLKRCDDENYWKAYQNIIDEVYFNQELEKRKIQYLKETELNEIDIDIESSLGTEVRHVIERKIWHTLTKKFLEKQQLEI